MLARAPELPGYPELGQLLTATPEPRFIASAPQSTAASAAGIHATFICGGFFGY